MEPDSYSPDHETNFERYRDLKGKINEEMERWASLSEEIEEFIQNKT